MDGVAMKLLIIAKRSKAKQNEAKRSKTNNKDEGGRAACRAIIHRRYDKARGGTNPAAAYGTTPVSRFFLASKQSAAKSTANSKRARLVRVMEV